MVEEGKKSVVLIVEDDEAVLDLLSMTLEMEGYEVFTAADGKTGLEMIRSRHPRAVLLDLMLPGMDGFAILEQMAADPETAKIPVTVVSAYADTYPAQEALQKAPNVRHVFTKPLRTEELLQKVQAMLAQP